MQNGFIFWEGPSQFNGEPIVAIATGLVRPSTNTKTGPMVQVYALSTRHPVEAVHSGYDAAICGDCVHRGRIEVGRDGKSRNVERSCYVTLFRGPHTVFKAYQQGLYERVTPVMAQRMLARRQVRLGAYGDMAAVPIEILDVVLAKAEAITGYTHAWERFPECSRFMMASVETEEEREAAHRLGFRTFRVRSKDGSALKGEGICPASKELGEQRVRCSECLACGGNSSIATGDISVLVHGSGSSHFEKNQSKHANSPKYEIAAETYAA